MSKEKKSMNKKISIGLIIVIILMAIVYSLNIVVGKSITIGQANMKLSDGGDYITKFVNMSENNFFNLRWSDVSDYYYTTTGTYESYTAKQKRVICMNEGKADWYNEYQGNNYQRALRPAAIIDIEGGYATVQGTISTTANKTYVGEAAARLAYAAYEEGSKVTWIPEAFINYGQGWLNFYNNATNINIEAEPSLKSTNNSDKYADEYTVDASMYANITTSGSGVGTTIDTGLEKEYGSFNLNGKIYQTKIGPYTLNNVSEVANKTVNAKVGDKSYTGIIAKSNNKYYLYFTNKITGVIENIKFTQSYNGYKAKILILATNYSQSRAVMIGKKDQTIKYEVNLKIPQQEIDVSLQKYITKVNNHSLTSSETTLASRTNKMTYSNESNTNVKKAISKNNTASDINKYDKTVNIELGDIVTYRIYVYNNSNYKADTVIIKDRLPYYSKDEKIVSYVEIISIKEKSGIDLTNEWKLVENPDENNYNTYYYTISNFAANSNTYFDITVKYTSNSSNLDKIYTNTAWISSTTPNNKETYRTVDRDYVKMKKYEVSLEKYISKVTENTSDENATVDASKYNNIKEYLGANKTIDKLQDLKNNSDINKDGKIDDKDLQLLQKYLDIGNANISKIANIKTNNLQNAKDYQKSDINGDGIINGTDVMIFGIINGRDGFKELIEQYIKIDINKDGAFNQEDINLYRYTLSDINGDGILDINDQILSLIYSNEISLENSDVNKLDLQKIKTYYIENAQKIKEYIISDVYQDGLIDDIDRKYWETYWDKIVENINTATVEDNKNKIEDNKNKINEIKNIIETYDANDDEKVNERDIETTPNLENEIQECIQNYDIDRNGSIEDNVFKLVIHYSDGKTSEGNITSNESNQREVSDIEFRVTGDCLFLQTQNNLINYEMQNKGKDEILALINECSNNNDSYYLYDINTDNTITQEDLTKYNELYENIDEVSNMISENSFIKNDTEKEFVNKLDEYIKSIGDIDFDKVKNISEFYNENITENSYFSSTDIDSSNNKEELLKRDLNNDNSIDYKDHEIYKTYVRFKNSPNEEKENLELVYYEYILNTEFTDEEKRWLLDGGYENSKSLDINGDEKITQDDYDLLDQYDEDTYIKRCKDTSLENIEKIIGYDVDGNGEFDQLDLELIEKYNSEILDLNGNKGFNSNDIDLLREIIDCVNVDNQTIIDIISSDTRITHDREEKAEYLTYQDGKYIDNTKNDTQWTQHNTYKYDNVVTVSNGYYVTYTIKVNNDGKTTVKNIVVKDNLPSGVEFVRAKGTKINATQNNNEVTINVNDTILPGASATFDIVVKVTEPNRSLEILKNTAKIHNNSMQNENGNTVTDITPNNNEDSDYIQLNYKNSDIIISGRVWNDKALNKTQDNYNGYYDKDKENLLSGIKVQLYRYGKGIIAEKLTDENGYYYFSDIDINNFIGEDGRTCTNKVITKEEEKHIKASFKEGTSRWNDEKQYYSYYIIFEYDGVKYTSTFTYKKDSEGKITNEIEKRIWNITENDLENNVIYSNAKEDLETRTNFNNDFSPVNNDSGIDYITNNQSEYIPQSIYQYNLDMEMQSSTDLINIGNVSEEQLKHVNLGLRGRDIFDLELTSDVAQVEINVNNQKGVYKYTNNVNLRKSDILSVAEDTANLESGDTRVVGENQDTKISGETTQNQNIRETDLNVSTTGAVNAYNNGVQSIFVTYKINVKNASRTDGTATKITNYYDNKYEFKGAYDNESDAASRNNNKLDVDAEGTKNNYSYKTIITAWDTITQANSKDIYIVYELKKSEYVNISETGMFTYNMAEIAEYTTTCAEGQTEYTRGLIDKDSAPGSADKEQVRTTDTVNQNTATTKGNPTTVEYYFGGNDLSKLKYEDDTYATPTLYFVKDGSQRTIEGFVFEDKTTTDSQTRIKTGNGILDEGEVGVYGATVQLIEVDNAGEPIAIRYECDTNKDGYFSFSGYLPGNYIIRYYYGNTTDTVLKNTLNDGNDETIINAKSYNGEDFHATNNSNKVEDANGNIIVNNILNTTADFWYVYNEGIGISTATDNTARRITVSGNVTDFIDEQMTVLNNMRDGKSVEDSKVTYRVTKEDGTTENLTVTVDNIIEKTWMFADTKPMVFTIEKTELVKDNDGNVTGTAQRTTFGEYKITDMNFGIAEVPVTTVDLQKDVKSFTLTDSTGNNIIARAAKDSEGKWDNSYKKGNTKTVDGWREITVEVENEKLQGARLEVTYNISVDMQTEKNFDSTENVVPTITGLVDFVNNNLSYNEALGNNAEYWELITFDKLDDELEAQRWEDGTLPEGTVDPEGKMYSTVLKAKAGNPLLLTKAGKGTATITLEKVLSSTESTIDEIITSTVDTSEYSNIVEITGFDYRNNTITDPDDNPTTDPTPDSDKVMRDRIRTKYRYIILPGVQHDSAISETIVIHPPTGDSSISIVYYVIAIIGLIVLAIGVFGIKKFVIKK